MESGSKGTVEDVSNSPIDVGIGDVVEFADDGGVLGMVTAIVTPALVTVEFPNGTTDVPAADLVVIRRAAETPRLLEGATDGDAVQDQ